MISAWHNCQFPRVVQLSCVHVSSVLNTSTLLSHNRCGLAKNHSTDSVRHTIKTKTATSLCVYVNDVWCVCELALKFTWLIVWISNGPEANSRIKHITYIECMYYCSKRCALIILRMAVADGFYWINDCGKSISLLLSLFICVVCVCVCVIALCSSAQRDYSAVNENIFVVNGMYWYCVCVCHW